MKPYSIWRHGVVWVVRTLMFVPIMVGVIAMEIETIVTIWATGVEE